MNSNFVACCTGRSAGFVPLRIFHVVGGLAEQILEVRPVGHEPALIDKLLLEVNSRQAVFAGKLDDPLSFVEKSASGGRQDRAHLFLLGGLKGDSRSLGSR